MDLYQTLEQTIAYLKQSEDSIDYRVVFSEVLSKRLNNAATSDVFPEYQPIIRNIFL